MRSCGRCPTGLFAQGPPHTQAFRTKSEEAINNLRKRSANARAPHTKTPSGRIRPLYRLPKTRMPMELNQLKRQLKDLGERTGSLRGFL